MNRVWIFGWFLVRDLFWSFSGLASIAATAAFGIVGFEYGMDQPRFITVAGLSVAALCFLVTLLLAGRANRAALYPLVARLHRRSELLCALVLGGIGVTWVLAVAVSLANLIAGRLTLEWPGLLWIVPTWLALWLFAAALALSLSALVSRNGSHLIGYVLLVAVLVGKDQTNWLSARRWVWPMRLVDLITWPFSNMLAQAAAGMHDRTYYLALLAVVGYSLLLFGLAVALVKEKDLIWAE